MTPRMNELSRALALAALIAACSGEPAVQRTSSEEGDANAPAAATETGEPSVATADQPAGAVTVATPAPGVVILAQEVDATPGLVAELTEATRKDGVLTVKVRFRNQGTETIHKSFETGHGDYSYFYVTAGDQKFFVLKDSDGAPLAPKYLSLNLDPGQTSIWWAKFPAPAAGETTIDLVIPDIPPFEDVALTDR